MATNIMTSGNPIYAGFLIAAILLIVIEVWQEHRHGKIHGLAWWALAGLTVVNLFGLLYFWVDRIGMSLASSQAEQSASLLLAHAMNGESFYRAYGDVAPMTIPPFYQLMSIPFALLFGPSVGTLRFVSVLGMIGSGMIVFRLATEKTGSHWWGLIGLGLFATAVGMIDSYMGAASPDPWLLCCALLGTYLLDRQDSESDVMLGILVLSNGVWFRQAGLFFLVGGLAYLTWSKGWTAAARYWLLGTLFSVLAWVTIGPLLFGSEFLKLTVFSLFNGLDFSLVRLLHYGVYLTTTYPLLTVAGISLVVASFVWKRAELDIWQIQFIAALLLGALSTLFYADNASMLTLTSVWIIIIGIQALYRWSIQIVFAQKLQLHLAALFASFVVAFRA